MPILLLDGGHVLPPVTPTITVTTPDGTLGCGIARAEIWTKGGGARVLDLPNITATEWSRVRSDTSDGSVTLDGSAIQNNPECCDILGTIRPWKHELHIYRDDSTGWLGPITEIDADTMIIKARDLTAWADRRYIHKQYQWGGTQANQGSEDSTSLFAVIIRDAFAPDPSPIAGRDGVSLDTGAPIAGVPFNYTGAGAGDLVQRTYTPAQFKHAGPEIRDLAKGALDWTMIKGTGVFGQGISWEPVTPNPVTNPRFAVDASGWTGMTRDTGVFYVSGASGRTGAPPNATGSITGLTVGKRYMLRGYFTGTRSALDAGQVPNMDGVVAVGNDQSSVFSWYTYVQPLAASFNNRGRGAWFQLATYFTATASTMPITITATGAPIDSHGIYFTQFDVMQQVPAFTLRDYSLATPPKVTLSGLDQANRVVVANQQSGGDYAVYGEAPKPAWTLGTYGPGLTADQAEFGLLEDIQTQPLSDSTSLQTTANQRNAMLGDTPLVIDKLVLSPDAGVTMDDLIPGVMFTLRLDHPCFSIATDLILQTVTVKTSPSSGETVTLTFQPAGF